jgi:hypothetical protein
MQPPKRPFQREVRRTRNIPTTVSHPGLPDRYCVVSNISHGGAKIVVEGSGPLPPRGKDRNARLA